MLPGRDRILIGYFPKRIVYRPEWLQAPNVVDICSVSECMSPGPDDWINRCRHNDMFVYDSPEMAWSVVDAAQAASFEMVAYRIVPRLFDRGEVEVLALPPLDVRELPNDFAFLGYDIVSRSQGNCFECSPLSCNGIAELQPVNAHCLVDDEPTAIRLAVEFSSEQGPGEPGPYCVMEVWRR